MNGATEATLIELLAVMQEQLKQQLLLKKLFDDWKKQSGTGGIGAGAGVGGGSAGLAGAALGTVTKAAGPLSLVFGGLSLIGNALSAAFDVMKSIVGKVVEGLGKTVGNLIDFGFQAMQGSTSVAKFVDAFRDLPFFLGSLASLFSKIIGYEESLLSSYQSISKTGATLGSNLFDLSQAAFRSFMSIDELTGIIREYGTVFASASGGIDQGIKKFTETQQALMGPGSPFRKDLLGLGFTFKEMGEYGALFMAMQTNAGRLNSMTARQQAAAVADMAKETDMYVKLSGQQREEVEKQMKQQAFDQNIKRFLQSLDPKQMEVAQAKLAKAQLDGGQGLYEQVAGTLMGFKGPITDAASEIYVQTKGASVGYAALAAEQVRNGKETAEGQRQQLKILSAGVDAFDRSVGGPMKTGVLALTGALRVSGELSKTANIQRDRTLEAVDALAMQKKQMEGLAGKLSDAQAQIKLLGSAIGGFLVTVLVAPFGNAITRITGGVLSALMGRFNKLSEPGGPLDNLAKKVDKWVNEHLQPIIDWFTKAFDDLTKAKPGEFWTTLGQRVVDGLTIIWQAIKPALTALWAELKPPLIAVWNDSIKPTIVKLFGELFEAMKSYFIGEKVTDENRPKFERQNEVNKSVMTTGERVGTFFAEFIEGFTGLFSTGFAERMAAGRIRDQMEAGKQLGRFDPNRSMPLESQPVQKATGSWGTTGRLIENFGTGTPAILHGEEGVITKDQMDQIMSYAMKSGGENKLSASIDRLNMLIGQLLAVSKDSADSTRKTADALSRRGNLLA